MKKTVRETTPLPKKEIARVRTRGPWYENGKEINSQRKDPRNIVAGSEKAERKEVEKEEEKEETSEAQKKNLVDKSANHNLGAYLCRKGKKKM